MNNFEISAKKYNKILTNKGGYFMKSNYPMTDLAIEAAECMTDTDGKTAEGIQVTKEDCILPETAVT